MTGGSGKTRSIVGAKRGHPANHAIKSVQCDSQSASALAQSRALGPAGVNSGRRVPEDLP